MRARFVNEDYYKDHGLDVYDKIVDYVFGLNDENYNEKDKEIIKQEYKDIILNDPYLYDMIEKEKIKGKTDSIKDIMRLGRIVYDKLGDK